MADGMFARLIERREPKVEGAAEAETRAASGAAPGAARQAEADPFDHLALEARLEAARTRRERVLAARGAAPARPRLPGGAGRVDAGRDNALRADAGRADARRYDGGRAAAARGGSDAAMLHAPLGREVAAPAAAAGSVRRAGRAAVPLAVFLAGVSLPLLAWVLTAAPPIGGAGPDDGPAPTGIAAAPEAGAPVSDPAVPLPGSAEPAAAPPAPAVAGEAPVLPAMPGDAPAGAPTGAAADPAAPQRLAAAAPENAPGAARGAAGLLDGGPAGARFGSNDVAPAAPDLGPIERLAARLAVPPVVGTEAPALFAVPAVPAAPAPASGPDAASPPDDAESGIAALPRAPESAADPLPLPDLAPLARLTARLAEPPAAAEALPSAAEAPRLARLAAPRDPAALPPAGLAVPAAPDAAGLAPGNDDGQLAALIRPPGPPPAGFPGDLGVRVVHPASAGEAAEAVAEALGEAGAAEVQVAAAGFSVSAGNVRFFHDEDAAAAAAVGELVAAATGGDALLVRDFTDFRPQPSPGTIEVYLPGEAPAAPASPPRTAAAPPPAAQSPAGAQAAAAQARQAQAARAAAERDALSQQVERMLAEQILQMQSR